MMIDASNRKRHVVVSYPSMALWWMTVVLGLIMMRPQDAADAFSTTSSHASWLADRQRMGISSSSQSIHHSQPSRTFPPLSMMNKNDNDSKKKKKASGGGGGRGFASANSGSSSSSSGSAVASSSQQQSPTASSSSFRYAGSIRPGRQSAQRVVMDRSIVMPDYAMDGMPKRGKSSPLLPWIIDVKKPDEIQRMRDAGRLARQILDMAGRMVEVGITTDEIDATVHQHTIAAGAYPSPLNYHGFPKSCCTSVNEVICHGIPDDRKLQDGDIINLDITVYLNGYHGDCSEMFVVGSVDDDAKKLLQVTYDCWIQACQYVKPGRDYKDLGGLIEDYIAPHRLSTVRNFCGHGIGSVFHTTPNILHYRNNEPNGQMAAGHTFTIEPMICERSNKVLSWPDDWTATTVDGGRSAQFEHTLLITEDGVEALTAKNEHSPLQFWERNSKIHQGFFLGTSEAARQRQAEINAKILG